MACRERWLGECCEPFGLWLGHQCLRRTTCCFRHVALTPAAMAPREWRRALWPPAQPESGSGRELTGMVSTFLQHLLLGFSPGFEITIHADFPAPDNLGHRTSGRII